MADRLIAFSERLWRDWLRGGLDVSEFVHKTFDLDAAPEPYLWLEAGARPLVVLTTNPGATMRHQRREIVRKGLGPLNPSMDYATAAVALGTYYPTILPKAALQRVAAFSSLAVLAGFDGVMQVEVCPFHSATLAMSKKLNFVRALASDALLAEYAVCVQAFLRARPVVILSAVSTTEELSKKLVARNPWLTWLVTLAGLAPGEARLVSLVRKGSRTTSAALVAWREGVPKALVLMMGGNHLPGQVGRLKLAQELKARASGIA